MSIQLTGPDFDGPSVTVERAAELLHCSRARVFELLREGRLTRAPRFGRRTTIVTGTVLACVKLGATRTEPSRHRRERRTTRSKALRSVSLNGELRHSASEVSPSKPGRPDDEDGEGK